MCPSKSSPQILFLSTSFYLFSLVYFTLLPFSSFFLIFLFFSFGGKSWENSNQAPVRMILMGIVFFLSLFSLLSFFLVFLSLPSLKEILSLFPSFTFSTCEEEFSSTIQVGKGKGVAEDEEKGKMRDKDEWIGMSFKRVSLLLPSSLTLPFPWIGHSFFLSPFFFFLSSSPVKGK